MFCSNCGKEVIGKFCTNCGTPVNVEATPISTPVTPTEESVATPNTTVPQFTYTNSSVNAYGDVPASATVPTTPKAPGSKKKILIPIIAVIAVIAIGLATFFIIRSNKGSSTPQKLMNKISKALEKNDMDAIEKLCNKKLNDKMKLLSGSGYIEDVIEEAEELYEDIHEEVGRINKVTFKILDTENYDTYFANSLTAMGIKTSAVMSFEVQLSARGNEGSDSFEVEIIAAKIGGRWYLIDID